MQTIINETHEHELNKLELYYNPKDIVLFDIETTGFVAEASCLYLIGCGYYKDDKWQVIQWFNDDGTSEKEIIIEFLRFIKGYKYLLNYNGDGFDIPYIYKKKTQYNIPIPFDEIESIDLYKHIRGFRDILKLDNLKQKTIEGFLGINRLDKYSGGDLIKVYHNYLKNKNDNVKTLLLQHNYEDIEGLMCSFSMLSYVKFKAGCVKVLKMSVVSKKLIFSIKLDAPLPKRITVGNSGIIITAFQYEGTINVPIVSEEMLFFFDNYKDYYYLPVEDMAVHKSVAKYVDKNYREQARKDNCYLKRRGHFISQINSGIISGYKKNYNDKETYIELVDSFLKDMDMLNAYARHIIQSSMNPHNI